MKTIYGENQILRVKDEIADVKVKSGKYQFIPKSEWKEKVRDAEKAKKKLEEQKSADESRAKKEAAKDKMKTSVKNPKK